MLVHGRSLPVLAVFQGPNEGPRAGENSMTGGEAVFVGGSALIMGVFWASYAYAIHVRQS